MPVLLPDVVAVLAFEDEHLKWDIIIGHDELM